MLPWYEYFIVFGIGGLICMLGQILIITTKITTARILVLFEMIGVFLVFYEQKRGCKKTAPNHISLAFKQDSVCNSRNRLTLF